MPKQKEHKLPEAYAHLQGLRVNDLVAKTARVTLKDTVRVMLALDTVAEFLGTSTDDLLGLVFSTDKPTPEQAEMCSKAFAEMERYLIEEGEGDWLDTLRSFD